jgi:hypothetical protein
VQTEITLGRVAEHLAMLEIGCRKCERYGRLRVPRLIEEHGAEKGLNELLGTLAADCPRQDAHSIHDRYVGEPLVRRQPVGAERHQCGAH